MAKQKGVTTEYRSYYLPMNFPVLLLSGSYWKISDVPSGRLHFHNYLEIGICHSHSGTMEFYGEPLHFKAGDVTVIPKNVPHTTYSTPGTESRWSYIYFDPQELFRGLLPASWKNHDLAISSSHDYKYILGREEYPPVHQLATAAVRELEEQLPHYQLNVKGLLLSLYIELYRIESAEDGEDAEGQVHAINEEQLPENTLVIAPALDFIEENYMQQFSVEHLADLCHWSPTHFRRVFHNIMGTSPLDYINNTRILKSCILLRSTEHSILDISEMVGFHSVSSYNRCFTKILHQSPRDYRKQTLQNEKRAENAPVPEYAGWMFPE